jgi:hypothetical protein
MAYEGFNYQHQILHPYYLGAVAELREWKCKPTSMDSSLYECSKISTTDPRELTHPLSHVNTCRSETYGIYRSWE